MHGDPVRAADTREWLVRASEDLRGAEVDLQASPPLIRDALFHAQQAVEIALKDFLTWHDKPFRKTHDLRDLGEQCAQIDPGVEKNLERSYYLTEYAWRFRYPGGGTGPALEEAQTALMVAREVVEFIVQQVAPELRP